MILFVGWVYWYCLEIILPKTHKNQKKKKHLFYYQMLLESAIIPALLVLAPAYNCA